MPNHETNNVVIIGEPAKIRAFIAEAFVHPGQSFPDSEEANEKDFPLLYFPLIIPEPENIERGGCPHGGMNRTLDFIDDDGREMVCWYGWNTANWGTKWGAYSHSHYALTWLKPWGGGDVYGRVDLRFETAWSQPTPILDAIQKRWGVTVHAVTQDEGGYPDVIFGGPFEAEVMHKVEAFEFDHWATEVDEPAVSA